MIYKLDPNLETDSNNYFISLLTDRFESLNQRWAAGLEKRFGKKFMPIYVIPSVHNKLFREENYIVINERLYQTQKQLHRKNVVLLSYPEDINRQFSESKFIQKLLQKLIKKQSQVFILSFSNVWLNIENPKVVLLGPDCKVAEKLDDKAEHIRIFKKLGFEINDTEIYENFDELKSGHHNFPLFVSAIFSSGGFESKAIYAPEDLDVFYSSLRPINKNGAFIASRFLENIIMAPNTNAVVSGLNKTTLVCVSDQILRDNHYMGNIYPSQASSKYQKEMEEMTIKVGNYISNLGFRGLFGLDFLITKDGHCYPTDLNPRRQGGYFCNVCMSEKVDLIDLELGIIFNEKLPKFQYKDFQVDYSWAHSKLTPYFNNLKIKKEFEKGSPNAPFQEVGAVYRAQYYPKNYLLVSGNPGFYCRSGRSYRSVKNKLLKDTAEIIRNTFKY